MGRVRTCGPNKASKNERKTQINIEIRDFFSSRKVCVCVGGGGGHHIVCPPHCQKCTSGTCLGVLTFVVTKIALYFCTCTL